MRKAYCNVIEGMRSDPSQYVLGLIDDLTENLSIMRRDYNVEGKAHLVRLISRSRGDRVQDLYMSRKYRTPYRGFPVTYNGKRGATLQIIIKRVDGV
eukprot:11371856-Karenia_brevis.AAC.1